ncbi:phosphopyruvate hydratase [Candidatus Woesearchaeota archaeon]|nr:phosphopyruvate hydratase [Candidatus Woesearchaeota archaeon]
MVTLQDVRARSILDSRGNPTVEAELLTKNGWVRASVPSGASTGVHEAIELRDNKPAFLGKGVSNAVKNINALRKYLVNKDWTQDRFDRFLITKDGTPNKGKLGANALLALSMACCKASAKVKHLPLYEHIANINHSARISLPIPSFNVINGGKHAGNQLDIQEYMVLPTKARTYSEALRIGSEVYHLLKKLLQNDFGRSATNVGDEGGFAPPLTCYTEPFDYIQRAIEEAGYTRKVKLGIDAAASEFYKKGTYHLEGQQLTAEQLLDRYVEMAKAYPLASIEDPFEQEDFDSFAALRKKLPKTQIVGDDLTVTNVDRIKTALHKNACNGLLLKINQIGTISEALDAAQLVKAHKWGVMVSHRSGETTDSFIADLAVGIDAGQIKSGAPCRGERLAKYNQLLRIEEELGKKARYGGALR